MGRGAEDAFVGPPEVDARGRGQGPDVGVPAPAKDDGPPQEAPQPRSPRRRVVPDGGPVLPAGPVAVAPAHRAALGGLVHGRRGVWVVPREGAHEHPGRRRPDRAAGLLRLQVTPRVLGGPPGLGHSPTVPETLPTAVGAGGGREPKSSCPFETKETGRTTLIDFGSGAGVEFSVCGGGVVSLW